MRIFLLLIVAAQPAAADDDGGVLVDLAQGMEPPARDNPEAQGLPLACDGDLCDTTNSSLISCDAAAGRPGGSSAVLVAALLLVVVALRRKSALVLILLFASATAAASPPPPVDVKIQEPSPKRRYVDISWNPLSLILTRLSFDVVITPADHHALVLSPHYFWTSTAPVFVYDDQLNATQLPRQYFEGGGGEIGYRYYFGKGGPRGWFVGPSLLLSWITATAQNGRQVSYLNYGGAVDGGYQLLIANRVSINLGLGLQYTGNSKDIPKQQFPALLQVNGGVWPRLLVSLGIAL